MTADENIHGINKSDSLTTLMQNSQWGAVAYLAQSEYGNMQQISDSESGIWNNSYAEGIAEAEVPIKNYSVTLTGMAGSNKNSSTEYYSIVKENSKKVEVDSVSITYKRSQENPATGEYTNTFYKYYTENGQRASTTRNIYGIYDTSGGAWEYMANYIENATNNSYINALKSLDKKYQTAYTGTGTTVSIEDRIANYKVNKEKYGDAIWETSNIKDEHSSWNGDYSLFPVIAEPTFLRGGYYNDSISAGMFYFANGWLRGEGSHNYTFRVVLI